MARTDYFPTSCDVSLPMDRAGPVKASQPQNFLLTEGDFKRQYSHVYHARIAKLRPIVTKRMNKEWMNEQAEAEGNQPELKDRILRLGDDTKVHACVCGTIYKEMKLKPCVLAEYAKKTQDGTDILDHLVSDSDILELEDESGRVELTGTIKHQKFVTGMVVGVRGRLTKDGSFHVEEFCLPGVPPQPTLPTLGEDQFVVIASGLQVGRPATDLLRLQLLADFLAGHLGSSQDISFASRIVRVILAGGVVGEKEPELEKEPGQPPIISRMKEVRVNRAKEIIDPLRHLDVFLTELASSVNVDVMPGEGDPANFCLPQQPLHPCLLPSAASYNTVSTVCNPHAVEVSGVRLLGTSGENVDDILKYSVLEDPLDALELSLQSNHIAPTAPDTLGCYPFGEKDRFVIESTPHVYFVGNQRSFSCRRFTGPEKQSVLLLSVPNFASSGMVACVNLRTLEAHPLCFDALL